MDSDIRKRLAKVTAKLSQNTDGSGHSPLASTKKDKQPFIRPSRKSLLGLLGLCIVLIPLILITLTKSSETRKPVQSIVPSEVSKHVDFPIYYPDPARLPKSYILDRTSFSATDNAVIYAVRQGDKTLTFSVQARPSDEDLDTFYANQLPLRDEVPTPIGDGAIGGVMGQTFVSIRAEKAWVIVTAQADINQTDLKAILKSMKRE